MRHSKHKSSGSFQPNAYKAALKTQRGAFFWVFALSALVNVLMLTGSIYMLQVYDRVLSSGSVPTLVGLFAIVVLLYAFLGLFDFLRNRLLSRIATRLDMGLSPDAFSAWLADGLNRNPSSESQPKPMRDLGMVRQFLSGPTATSLFDIPFVPIFIVAMFLIHPWLGMMVIAGAAVSATIAFAGRFLTAKLQDKSAGQEGASHEFSTQSHQSADIIAAMGMQRNVSAHWQDMHNASLSTQQHVSNPSEVLTASSKTFRMLLQSSILTVGALLVLQNQISAGMIIASSVLSSRALAPLDQIIGQWRGIGRAIAAHRGLRDFFDYQPLKSKFVTLPEPSGRIEVNQLTKFAPKAGAQTPTALLHGIQFTLEPGDGMGVIGKSASGKSTLARLLIGAWQAEKGEIRFDGATHDQWDPAVLGKSVGYLPQKVDMLPGTIAANIARFDSQATDTDVIAAANLAGIHEMILALPEGYATRVGGHAAAPLSGGQVQRLGLARAVYGMPRIVVLDEPNANLDAEGDEALGNAITALRDAGSTVIVMAHRPSAIAAVNKVLILNDGRMMRFDDKDKVLGPPKAVQPTGDVAPFPKSAAANAPKRTEVDLSDPMPEIRASADTKVDVPFEETKLAKILKAERLRAKSDPAPSLTQVFEAS